MTHQQVTELLAQLNNLNTAASIIAVLFIIYLVMRQVVRLMTGQQQSGSSKDSTLNTLVTQLSLVITTQSATAEKRDREYQDLFKEISERNAKADDRWQLVLEQHTAAQTSHTTAVKAMDSRTGHLLLAVQTLDQNINTTTLNLGALAALGNEIKADVNRVYDRLALLFPRDEAVDAMVEKIIVDAVKEGCKEKRASDEHPVATLPAIVKEREPESGIAAPPGSGEVAA